MKKILFITFLFGFILSVYSQNKNDFPDFLKEKEFLIYESDTNSVSSFKNIIIEKNIISNFNNNANFHSYNAILKDDSIKMMIKHLQFNRTIEAYEFFCNFFSLGDEKIMDLGWRSILINDSLSITWYKTGIYIFSFQEQTNKKFEKLLKKIIISTDKFENIPNFVNVFPKDDMISHACKISISSFLQQTYFPQTYYADYESKGNISRIFIIPVLKDSIFIQFQKFRKFWKNRGLLVDLETPVELPNFVAQDVFLGRMICVIYQDYIIGVMNYPSLDWTKEHLEKVKDNLKKYPIPFENPATKILP